MGSKKSGDSMSSRMNLIAAVSGEQMGIGKANALPWHLPKEYAHFVRLTTETRDPAKRNAVVMGRRCWESIPDKFRPLKNRINVVLSRTMDAPPAAGVHLCRSLDEAVELLTQGPLAAGVETVWNVGGRDVYAAGMAHPLCHRLYITRIRQCVDCDVFFPPVDWDKFTEVPEFDDEVHTERELDYTFHVYEKRA